LKWQPWVEQRPWGKESDLGSLEEGKLADLVLMNLAVAHNAPWEAGDIVSQLVYSATSADVHTTIIDGNVVMKNRVLTTIDEDALLKDANRVIKERIIKAGVIK
jgi:5-methylthioadenosine/S-adenosylhomocysteine deaminase